MRIDPREYVRVGTAATLIGVTRAAIAKAIRQGRLPSVVIDGQHFISRKDVERYAAGRK
jgi:excisionase family DNA binding protein